MKYLNILLATFLLAAPFQAFAEDEHGHDHGESKSEKGEHAHGDSDEHGHGHEEAAPDLTIADADLARFGLAVETAGPRNIIDGIPVSGRIVPVDDKLAHVSPRFPGVVKEVKVKVGDIVKADTLLAVVQNNQNLQTFSIYPSIPGVVIKRHATLGEAVGENSVLFVVADLSEVWAELAVYKQDVDKVKSGQPARLYIASHLKPEEGEIVFFSPITEERSQSRIARVQLKNPDPHFSPGAFVSGSIITAQSTVPVAVNVNAIQRMEGNDAIFVREGQGFEARPVTLGKKDDSYVEVLTGLKAGESYATGNTFVLKAELGKSEAEHEH